MTAGAAADCEVDEAAAGEPTARKPVLDVGVISCSLLTEAGREVLGDDFIRRVHVAVTAVVERISDGGTRERSGRGIVAGFDFVFRIHDGAGRAVARTARGAAEVEDIRFGQVQSWYRMVGALQGDLQPLAEYRRVNR